MYQEQLAKLTADHLRTHIKAYLAEIAAGFDAKNQVPLVVPKAIETASAVGGLIQDFDKILPRYGVDVFGKDAGATDDSLNSWVYSGQIVGVVHGSSQSSVDKIVKRHMAAVELFIARHRLLHLEKNNYYSILNFGFVANETSGAEAIGDLWIAGFTFECIWITSEYEAFQHG
jgi:hypothetical protein